MATKGDLAELESTTKDGFADVQLEFAKVKAEQNLIKWMLDVVIAISIANFAKQYF